MFNRNNSGKGHGILGGVGGGGGLPVTGLGGKYRRNPNTSLFAFITNIFDRNSKNKKLDGSAASIQVGPSVGEAWEKASTITKVTWILFFTFIFLAYFGYRNIRYYNSGIVLDCVANACSLKLIHQGWARPTKITIGRHQIVRTEPVKVTKDGTYVSGNASLKVDYSKSKYNKKTGGAYSDSLNYKGPDSDGNYLSYAIFFKDKSNEKYTSEAQEILDEEYDISKIHPYLTKDGEEYRLIVRQQVPGDTLSKRRVRTMTQKIDSYITKRRHNMVARETSGPAVTGVIMVVVGIFGFLLTCLLGQFQDENPYYQSGPGIRRQQNQQIRHHSKMDDPTKRYDTVINQRQIPSKYEVRTQSVKPPPPPVAAKSSTSATKTGYQTNTTSATRRK